MKKHKLFSQVLVAFAVIISSLLPLSPAKAVGPWPIVPPGISYYVSADQGNDSNDGLTRQTPFRTLAHSVLVVNGTSKLLGTVTLVFMPLDNPPEIGPAVFDVTNDITLTRSMVDFVGEGVLGTHIRYLQSTIPTEQHSHLIITSLSSVAIRHINFIDVGILLNSPIDGFDFDGQNNGGFFFATSGTAAIAINGTLEGRPQNITVQNASWFSSMHNQVPNSTPEPLIYSKNADYVTIMHNYFQSQDYLPQLVFAGGFGNNHVAADFNTTVPPTDPYDKYDFPINTNTNLSLLDDN